MRLCFSHSLIPQRFDLLITQYILYCYNILFTVRTSPMCEWGGWLSCHRMAHFVLIRCYLQSSLSEAPRCRTFFSTGTVCTSPMCEWGGWLSCHRMAHFVLIRCYLQSSLSEAPRCRTFFSTGHCPDRSDSSFKPITSSYCHSL